MQFFTWLKSSKIPKKKKEKKKGAFSIFLPLKQELNTNKCLSISYIQKFLMVPLITLTWKKKEKLTDSSFLKNKKQVKVCDKVRQKDMRWIASWLRSKRNTNVIRTLFYCVGGPVKIGSKDKLIVKRRPLLPSDGVLARAGWLGSPRDSCFRLALVPGLHTCHFQTLWTR